MSVPGLPGSVVPIGSGTPSGSPANPPRPGDGFASRTYSSRRRCLAPLSATDVLSTGTRRSSARRVARLAPAPPLRSPPRRGSRTGAGPPLPTFRPRVAVQLAPHDPPCPTAPHSPSRSSLPRALSARASRDLPFTDTPCRSRRTRVDPAATTTTKARCRRAAPTPRPPRPRVPSTAGPARPICVRNARSRSPEQAFASSPRARDLSFQHVIALGCPSTTATDFSATSTAFGFPTARSTPAPGRRSMPPDGFCRPRRSTSTPPTTPCSAWLRE